MGIHRRIIGALKNGGETAFFLAVMAIAPMAVMVVGGTVILAHIISSAWMNAGISGRAALLGTPIAISIAIWLSAPSPEEKYCRSAEYVVQEAGECLIHPETWGRRAEILRAYSYDGDENRCTDFIEKLPAIKVSRAEAMKVARWTEREESNVRAYWENVVGTDFCSAILARR